MPGRGAFSGTGANPDGKAASARAAALERLENEVVCTLSGSSARDMAGPLAVRAMRVAEAALCEVVAGLGDRDERVRATAARTALQMAPRIAELAPVDAPPAPSDADRDTALRAALESDECIAVVLAAAAYGESRLRAALVDAGWVAPEDGG